MYALDAYSRSLTDSTYCDLHSLAQYAIMCMGSQTKTSPFEREAARHGIRYPGGKVDDVAVVAALVMEQ